MGIDGGMMMGEPVKAAERNSHNWCVHSESLLTHEVERLLMRFKNESQRMVLRKRNRPRYDQRGGPDICDRASGGGGLVGAPPTPEVNGNITA